MRERVREKYRMRESERREIPNERESAREKEEKYRMRESEREREVEKYRMRERVRERKKRNTE